MIGGRAAAQYQQQSMISGGRLEKYQPALGGTDIVRSVKEGWMKIKWALCKKEDFSIFKADLVGHTRSIQLLLTTVHMYDAYLELWNKC